MKKFHRTVGISTVLLLIVLVINYTLGMDLGKLDEIFPFLTMPPGITFAINWSLIYLGLITAILSRWSHRVKWNKQRTEINYLFWISCLFNICWIVVTYFQEYALSVFFLGGLCYVLYRIVRMLKEKQKKLHTSWMTEIPFSLYLGWISTAFSVIGLSQLVYIGLGESIALSVEWTAASLIIGVSFISLIITKTSKRVGLLPTFALTMVALKNLETGDTTITLFSLFGALIIGYVSLFRSPT